MTRNVLHISNGDSATSLLLKSEVAGDVLPWRDVLHEGPVPGGLTLGELSEVRAGFLSDDDTFPLADTQRAFALRDEHLQGCDRYDEVILWFEHDLYDQLQILQILDWFHANPARHALRTLICIDRFPGIEPFWGLGQLNETQIASLHGSQAPITLEQTALATRGWQAFTHTDPVLLDAYRRDDIPALPFMRNALTRFLEEYPSVENGLGRTEQQILALIAAGEPRPGRLFGENQHRETAPFMGDSSFWQRIGTLCSGPEPLLECTPAPFRVPSMRPPNQAFRDQRLALTAAGERVLAGRTDWLNLHRPDVWMGGVHLAEGMPVWRWNRTTGTIEARG